MGEVGQEHRRPFVVAVVGPTAAGKTAVGVALALRIGAEVVSADARQVYRWMDIGTAKPGVEDRRRVPHHLLDILDPTEAYSSGRYGPDARAAIEDILARGRVPLVVGGSGLYVRAAVDGLFEGPSADPVLRSRLEDLWRREGEDGLRRALTAVDAETAKRTEPGKPRRLIRALEVFELTGVPLSEHHRRQARLSPYEVLWIGMTPDREELYRRIDLRVVAMLEQGLIEEVRGLLGRGYARSLNALNTVGYREVFDLLEGATDERTMMRSIQTHTRQYAKRQLTWFRADGRIHWLSRPDQRTADELAEEIVRMIDARRRH